VVLLLEVLSNVTMVVDLTVDGENDAVVGVGQGLSARLCR
jgi:poly-beta-hydroxyalkanoate depolymerase